jgi:hypothetical protein
MVNLKIFININTHTKRGKITGFGMISSRYMLAYIIIIIINSNVALSSSIILDKDKPKTCNFASIHMFFKNTTPVGSS